MTASWNRQKPLENQLASGYDLIMKTTQHSPMLEQLVGSLGDCLTEESARRLLSLKANAKLQTRVNQMADRSSRGLATPEERAEYYSYVTFGTFVAILKSKARQFLANSQGQQ